MKERYINTLEDQSQGQTLQSDIEGMNMGLHAYLGSAENKVNKTYDHLHSFIFKQSHS